MKKLNASLFWLKSSPPRSVLNSQVKPWLVDWLYKNLVLPRFDFEITQELSETLGIYIPDFWDGL